MEGRSDMYQIADLIDDESMINVATWLQNYHLDVSSK